MTPLHFTTNNRVLAAGLSMSDIPLASVFNVYDEAALVRAECKSIKEAREQGIPGVLTYVFERTDELEAALIVWDETHKWVKSLNLKDKSDRIKAACVVLNLSPLSSEILKDGTDFREVWKRFPASFIVRKGEAVTTQNPDGSKTLTSPGFVVVGEGVSEEKAKALGL